MEEEQTLDEMKLDDLGSNYSDDSTPDVAVADIKPQPTSFVGGEQEIELSNGNYTIKTHFTNATAEQTCELSIWLLQQLKTEPTKKTGGYVG